MCARDVARGPGGGATTGEEPPARRGQEVEGDAAMPVELRRDLTKNRLYLTLTGLVLDGELGEGVDRLVRLAQGMRPGLTVLTDLSACRPLSQRGVAEVRRGALALMQRGLRATARVVPQPTVASLQFQRVSGEAGYAAFIATTRLDAERLLDEDVRSAAEFSVSRLA